MPATQHAADATCRRRRIRSATRAFSRSRHRLTGTAESAADGWRSAVAKAAALGPGLPAAPQATRATGSLSLAGFGLGYADLALPGDLGGLRRLDLSGNGLTELSTPAGLPLLEVLLLDSDRVVELGALTHFAQREHLSVADNGGADLAPLADLVSLRLPAAEAGAQFERLVHLRWPWRSDLGKCLGCGAGRDARTDR